MVIPFYSLPGVEAFTLPFGGLVFGSAAVICAFSTLRLDVQRALGTLLNLFLFMRLLV
jgi:hypothetical protein